MRLDVWWGAAALTLLTVAAALRTTQVDGTVRGRRILPSSTDSSELASSNKDAETIYRIRGYRRKEETSSVPTRSVSRSRGRSRPAPTSEATYTERPEGQSGRNERFDLRRTRTRNGLVENEATVSSSTPRSNANRSRIRTTQRQSSSPSPVEVSSETNQAIENTSNETLPSNEKEDIPVSNQFRRRSFASQTTENIVPTQYRGRINRKNNGRIFDLVDSGTTNAVTILGKEPTTARSTEDLRASRKLRYRTRFSEIDSNLTGDGMGTSQEKVKKAAEQTETGTSQTDQSTESLNVLSINNTSDKNTPKPETKATLKITRRVPIRGKAGFKHAVSTSAPKISDEVSEDDNYPESFKALLQAKSASTQANSPPSESLSVKESQTVYKTYVPPSQSTDTDLTSEKDSGFKNKIKGLEKINEDSYPVHSNDAVTPKSIEPKPRTFFKPRTRKYSSFSTTSKPVSSADAVSSPEKPTHKYNRKIKFTTTSSPNLDKPKDKEELRSKWKKPLIRQSYISRRKPEGNDSSENTDVTNTISSTTRKPKPSRSELLSKYSRGNRFKSSTTTTEASNIKDMVDQSSTEKVADNTANMPFIITLLSSTENTQQQVTDRTSENPIPKADNNVFIIAVSSTESAENKVDNGRSVEEPTGSRPGDISYTTSKYHANFKISQEDTSEIPVAAASPVIKNINLRNRDRYNAATITGPSQQKYRGRNNRKYKSETFSKTTDGDANVITQEPERSKSRFSSKYRSSYADKPIYKATVPTVTPSTAWLKFFVTDHLLTKTAEEPIWFDEADLYTTEPMPRQFITSPPYIHEPSLQLDEGEEIQLGPNTNAFAITQTRRPLSSADLRLSESLEKQLHVMNVEASQHSPSVTVSIFGALADVLTSTPRTRLSSTTVVSQKQNNVVDVKESLIDVSNSNNVNSSDVLKPNQDVSINKDVNTVQTTANVINNLSGGESVPILLSTIDEVNPTSILSTTPNPTSTTPLSARRPFAFKVLYSNTESPTDIIQTASTNQLSTDSSPDTVSDILIPSNNLVSSELTSMLTNNIRDILANMNDSDKSKLSVDMAQLLKSLIPKALDRRTTALDDVEVVPNTTPYTLEDIINSQNVETGIVNENIDSNSLQSESSNMLVYSTVATIDGFVSNETEQVVNNNENNDLNIQFNRQVPITEPTIISQVSNDLTTLSSPLSDSDVGQSAFIDVKDMNSVVEQTDSTEKVDDNIVNKSLPVPFFTNLQVEDDESIDENLDSKDVLLKSTVRLSEEMKVNDNSDTNSPLIQTSTLPTQQELSMDRQSSVQISTAQLWVLSRKAKVLQMIEELLRQHNDELATIPLAGIMNTTNDPQLSNRLTTILGGINETVNTTDISDLIPNDVFPPTTSSSSISSIPPIIFTTESETIQFAINENRVDEAMFRETVSSTMPVTTPNTTPVTMSVTTPDITTITSPVTMPVTMPITKSDTTTVTTSVTVPVTMTVTTSDTTTVTTPVTMPVTTSITTPISTPETAPFETTVNGENFATTIQTSISLRFPMETQDSEKIAETTTNSPISLTTASLATEFENPIYTTNSIIPSEASESALTTTESVAQVTNTIRSEITTSETIPPINPTTQDLTDTEISTNTVAIETTTTQYTNSNNDIATTTNPTEAQTTEISYSSPETTSNQPIVTSQAAIPKKDYVIFGILPNNTVVRKDPNDDILETLTESSPYIIYGVLPNNTIIRRFPNGTRVPRVMQKIDVLPISPWSLKNPYSPIHYNPAIVRPKSNPIQVNTITETSTDTSNNGNENQLTTDTVNNSQNMIPPPTLRLNVNGSSSFGITTVTNQPSAEKSTASHVLSLRTSTMLPSVDEILLNSISSAIKQNMVLSEQNMPTDETRILTLDIDPETKQIRTEKPGDGSEGAVFKFIPVEEVMVTPTDTNVLKITPTKATMTNTESTLTTMPTTITESQTQSRGESLTTNQEAITTTEPQRPVYTNPATTESSFDSLETKPDVESTSIPSTFVQTTTAPEIITAAATTTATPVTAVAATTTPVVTTTTAAPITTTTIQETTTRTSFAPYTETTTFTVPTTQSFTTTTNTKNYQDESALYSKLLNNAERNPKNLNSLNNMQSGKKQQENLLNALLLSTNKANKVKVATTTPRSLEDDLRQLEEDTKLLKALLAATGQDPSKLNLPSLPNFNIPTKKFATTTNTPFTTTPTTNRPTTVSFEATTRSVNDYGQDNEKLLASLLQNSGITINDFNMPVISGDTSQVRIASNIKTTSRNSNPTTPYIIRPVYTTVAPTTQNTLPPIVPIVNVLQQEIITEDVGGISTTYSPRATTSRSVPTTRRTQSRRFTTTTELPSTSTFSVQEDLMFLQNLKTVLKTNTNSEDPEAALANRIIALAVERSLDEIQTGNQTVRTETTTLPTTTTTTFRTTTTTTTAVPTTTQTQKTPSLEEDIKQFEEDTKLLKALIQATGQDPSSFNIPTLPSIITTTTVSSTANKAVINSLSSHYTLKPSKPSTQHTIITSAKDPTTVSTTARPFGARIAVKDNLKTVQDDEKLLKTLVKLQGIQETTTQRPKLAVTGQTRDEALNTLIKQKKPAVMASEATKAPISLSTEYGKSQDALLAALLKEQGFGPTTASSLDEQQRLSALLNHVVVTPKARRPTAPPPPPPAPRRPILDGLAWLWQQWQETGPGPGGSRPKKPAETSSPSSSFGGGGQRVNWFGSGPFVGNADDGASSNRIPLEPPRAVTAEGPARGGQLVSAAINVTRAFSQFLGAAIQGAAQTVRSVFQAGQRVAADAYTSGSGGSG